MTHIKPLLLLVATLAFGAAPLITPSFSGFDPGQFPVQIERPFIQPAGYAFSIWGVIYLWLIAHAVFGLWRRADDPAWDRVRLPLILSVGLGTVWLAIAGASPIWATITIWIMAVASLAAFLRADTQVDRWMLSAPLAILAGWLSAASAVSLGVALMGYGWLSNTGATLAMLALVLVIAVVVQLRQPRMPIYGLTVIWALAGVVAVNLADAQHIVIAAACGMVAIALILLANLRWGILRPT